VRRRGFIGALTGLVAACRLPPAPVVLPVVAPAWPDVDVYLNGMLLRQGDDYYTSSGSGDIKLDFDKGPGDVITMMGIDRWKQATRSGS